MHPPFFSAGGSYQSRCGIVCSAALNPGALTSWVVAAICCVWKSGILPSGHNATRSPAIAAAATHNQEQSIKYFFIISPAQLSSSTNCLSSFNSLSSFNAHLRSVRHVRCFALLLSRRFPNFVGSPPNRAPETGGLSSLPPRALGIRAQHAKKKVPKKMPGKQCIDGRIQLC